LGIVPSTGNICFDVLENVVPFNKGVGVFYNLNPLVQVIGDLVPENLCKGSIVNGNSSLFVHVNCVVVFDVGLVVDSFD